MTSITPDIPGPCTAAPRRALTATIVAAALLAGCAPASPRSTTELPPVGAVPPTTPAAAPRLDCPVEIESEALVDVRSLDPSLVIEIRYATDDNFTGAPLPGYEVPAALLTPASARALARVQQRLHGEGLGLKVWDAYRPVRATLAMVDWAERTGNTWVLDQGYVARRSGHNRGNTVDLTLVRLDGGEELDMGTAYDEFSEAAHTANATGEVMSNRRLLLEAMAAQGWVNYSQEWWHWSYPAPIDPLDVPIGCFLR